MMVLEVCFRRNFITASGTSTDKMYEVLILHREQTRTIDKTELQTFGIGLFLKHCRNCNDVISQTEDNVNSLFGEIGGGRPSDNETSSSSSSGWKPALKALDNDLVQEQTAHSLFLLRHQRRNL